MFLNISEVCLTSVSDLSAAAASPDSCCICLV